MNDSRDMFLRLMDLLKPYAYDGASRIHVELWTGLADIDLQLKPPADATADTGSEARRTLFDVAEAALAAIEGGGWRHGTAPDIRITGLEVTGFGDARARFVWQGNLTMRLLGPTP